MGGRAGQESGGKMGGRAGQESGGKGGGAWMAGAGGQCAIQVGPLIHPLGSPLSCLSCVFICRIFMYNVSHSPYNNELFGGTCPHFHYRLLCPLRSTLVIYR